MLESSIYALATNIYLFIYLFEELPFAELQMTSQKFPIIIIDCDWKCGKFIYIFSFYFFDHYSVESLVNVVGTSAIV